MRKYQRFIINRYSNKYHIGMSQLWHRYQEIGLSKALRWYGVR